MQRNTNDPRRMKKNPVQHSGGGSRDAAAHYGQRADLGASADGYFARQRPPQREIAQQLRAIVRAAAPAAEEAIKWGMPVYTLNGLLCYVRVAPGYVALGFYESGTRLTDPDKLLEGTGEAMRHVKVRSARDMRPELFTKWVQEAAAMNAK